MRCGRSELLVDCGERTQASAGRTSKPTLLVTNVRSESVGWEMERRKLAVCVTSYVLQRQRARCFAVYIGEVVFSREAGRDHDLSGLLQDIRISGKSRYGAADELWGF